MKKLQVLAALFLVAGTADLFAGKTFRNTPEEGDARERALRAWGKDGSKKSANRAGVQPKPAKPVKETMPPTVTAVAKALVSGNKN